MSRNLVDRGATRGTYMSHGSHIWVMFHINESCLETSLIEARHVAYMVVESHIWMRFIAYINESRLYIWMSHVSGTVWIAAERWGTCGRVSRMNDFDVSEMNLIHIRDSTTCATTLMWHLWSSLEYESHMNAVNCIWMRFISDISKSCPKTVWIAARDFKTPSRMWHMNASCRIRMRHVTYAYGASDMDESCPGVFE